ncbi:MAG TPA: SpoIIE family protein phosphatase [Vicinamibacterales bacterium]|nr:SpoIIE family protein phosphatase [Vicinamibacterales bacterium]
MADARLEVSDAQGRRVVPLDKPAFTIGRRSANDLQLTGTDVSRDHAEILRSDGQYLVRDRGSRCGTYVNGAQVTEKRLSHGDRIQVGRTAGAQLLFLLHDKSADTGSRSGASGIVGGFRQVATLLEALRALGSSRVLDEVLTLVMDAAIDLTGAERGFVMLANERGELEPKLARMRGHMSLGGVRFDTSRKIPEQVFATGKELVIADLPEGNLADAHLATIAHGIRHVLCVPLLLVRYVDQPGAPIESRPTGVLYLDSREKGTLLSQATREALETLAAEAAVAIENAQLYRESVEKRRIDDELRIASQIQQALLPRSRTRGSFYDASGTSIACRAIGGDFFEYIDLPDGSFGFALGDVSGKGPPAALLTAMLQGMFSTQAFAPVEPAEMMTRVNRALLARGIESRFATIFYAILRADGRLTYCNAGQNPPLLFSASGVRKLETGGMIVGLFPYASYQQEDLRLAAGDALAIFSDGVSEALNGSGEEYGEARIQDAVAPNWLEPSDAVLQALLESVRGFAQGAPQNDDVTALIVRYTPKQS